ncbi:MAG: hypothetical protein KA603_03345 [Azonexus sp.]|nr:hypothetical protein [Betaproteobacteria bacterium]MBK8919224.1 hypothetical protein [Betaproteobacteria bacterium]MBP6035152.1 hypothetical protein [Azonexus sp.]MBP6905735.1 hypothetical protein [Azonexus sp.]
MTAKPVAGSSPKGSRKPGRRPAEYIAAVRYHDGTRDLVRVRNADDMADARAMVLDELDGVRAVVIAARH